MASHSTKQAIWKVKAVSSNSSALNKIDTETATLCERENFLATIRIEKAHIKSELASRFLSDLERKTKNEIIAIKRSLLIGHRLNQRYIWLLFVYCLLSQFLFHVTMSS